VAAWEGDSGDLERNMLVCESDKGDMSQGDTSQGDTSQGDTDPDMSVDRESPEQESVEEESSEVGDKDGNTIAAVGMGNNCTDNIVSVIALDGCLRLLEPDGDALVGDVLQELAGDPKYRQRAIVVCDNRVLEEDEQLLEISKGLPGTHPQFVVKLREDPGNSCISTGLDHDFQIAPYDSVSWNGDSCVAWDLITRHKHTVNRKHSIGDLALLSAPKSVK
jgi:hypothetical protein